MKDYILIRGPIGVGKTVVGKRLSDKLIAGGYNGSFLEFDVFRRNNIGKEINYLNKKRAIELIVPKINNLISSKYIPILENVFYEKDLVDYLLKNINGEALRIKLFAPLNICIERNYSRKFPREEYRVTKTWEFLQENNPDEINIQTWNKTIEEVLEEVYFHFISS